MQDRRDDAGRFTATHGASFTREYRVWGNMLYRCGTPTAEEVQPC